MTGIALGDTDRQSRRYVGTYMIDVSMFVFTVASFFIYKAFSYDSSVSLFHVILVSAITSCLMEGPSES